MGQTNLKRTQFKGREEVTTPQSSAQQPVARTCFFEIADVVDVIDVDTNGNILSTIANNLTVLGIVTDQEISLSAVVDTTNFDENSFRLYTTSLDGNTSDRLGGTLGFTTEMRTSPSISKVVSNSQSVESEQLSPSGYSVFTQVSNRGGTTHIDEMKFDAEL